LWGKPFLQKVFSPHPFPKTWTEMRDIPSASTSGGFPKNSGTGEFFTTDTFEEILARPRQVVSHTPFQKLGLRCGTLFVRSCLLLNHLHRSA
jgi:hypothetical protein